jgi:hypothetical protein
MRRSLSFASLLLAGCWKDDLAQIPPGVLEFQPEIEAPAGWLVMPVPAGLECPDGEPAQSYLLYPQEAEGKGPIPGAVLYHSGTFDFVFAPDASDPLLGTHYREPSRLTAQWAIRQVFATLGMYPDQDQTQVLDGSLPVALAERGVATLLPANCWGDLWANKRGGADNDFTADFFFREGRATTEWSYRFLVDPAFAASFDVELPISIDPAEIYALGLGEGGRAVAELLSIDNDADTVPDYQVTAAFVDSTSDDLRVYFQDAGLYATTVEGLTRLFPDREVEGLVVSGVERTASGSFWSAPLPPRLAYLYSTADPLLPESIHEAAVTRLESLDSAWVYGIETRAHVLSNDASEPDLARDVVAYLVDGTRPGR